MATPISTTTMKARRLVIEDGGPSGSSQGSPCQGASPQRSQGASPQRSQGASPQRSQSPGSPKRNIIQIARDFEACCDEVLAALDSQPGGSPGAGVAEAAGCAHTNLVKPNLEEMLHMLQVATAYIEERKCHTNILKAHIEENMLTVNGFRCLLDNFDPIVEGGMRMVPDYVRMWSMHSEGFANIHQCLNGDNPVPNITAINHPSQCVTQDAYSDLVWELMSLCSSAERQCRLSELMYSQLDEDRERIRQTLDNSERSLQYFDDLSSTLAAEDQALLNLFNENHQKVAMFLAEWQKGGEQLNQPASSPMGTPEFSPQAGASARCPETPYYTPGTTPTHSTPLTPTPELQERIRCLDDMKGRKKEVLEDLVQRYADLHGSILNEVKNIRDQNDVLNESLIAMEGVREKPGESTRPSVAPSGKSAKAPATSPPSAVQSVTEPPPAEDPETTE